VQDRAVTSRQQPDQWAWDHAPQARFVTPREWYDGLPADVHGWMALSVVAEALADASDEQGVIFNFVEVTFYTRHIARVLSRQLADHEVVEPLTYDRFSALALADAVNTILRRELLAAGGHDNNTLHYRLTLPHIVQEGRTGQWPGPAPAGPVAFQDQIAGWRRSAPGWSG
jgi:hypothetical protein